MAMKQHVVATQVYVVKSVPNFTWDSVDQFALGKEVAVASRPYGRWGARVRSMLLAVSTSSLSAVTNIL